MSTPAPPPGSTGPPAGPPAGIPEGTIACPRCGSPIGPSQDWCVTCGVAARTRVAPVPHWRRPIATVAVVAALALAAVAVALVSLSSSDAPPGADTLTAVTGPPVLAPITTQAAPGVIGVPTTVNPAIPGQTTSTTATTSTTTSTSTVPTGTTPAPPTGGGAAPR